MSSHGAAIILPMNHNKQLKSLVHHGLAMSEECTQEKYAEQFIETMEVYVCGSPKEQL